jgi:hypothetical protein
MQGKFLALQLFAVNFITLFGLYLLKSGNPGQGLVGAIMAGLGLTFLMLLFVNLKKPAR